MFIGREFKTAVKRVVFGDTLLPQDFTIGLVEPQTEIAVWMHGTAAPRDVTSYSSMACSDPFTVCIAFDQNQLPPEQPLRRLTLQFCERSGHQRVLGEIGLKPSAIIAAPGGPKLLFFEARSAAIYCLSKRHLWAHRLLQAFSNRRRVRNSGAALSSVERRATIVNFIRPHPIVLVSVVGDAGSTIFPMNLTGDLGNGRFGLALQSAKRPRHLVESAGRIAVSTVPPPQARFAYQLGASHSMKSLDWSELPFATEPSATLKIPVPDFALRVREMEIEQAHRIGLHTFFVARIVSDERLADGPAVHTIHGHYQAFRVQGRPAELEASLLADASHKGK